MSTESSNPEISALKNQMFTLLIALVVISGTLTVYLFRQASLAGKDLSQNEPLIVQNEQAMSGFVAKIVAYGEKHPDFAKTVLAKYGIAPVPGIPANAPATPPKK